jgi:glutathione synthase
MKMGLLVNNIFTEKANYTTTLIAMTATNMGHEVFYISVDQLSYGVDDTVYAASLKVTPGKYRTLKTYLNNLQSEKAIHQKLILDKLDVFCWTRYCRKQIDGN